MAYEYSLCGTLDYASASAATKAVDQLDRLIVGDDPDFRSYFEEVRDTAFVINGASLQVEIYLSGPGDFWFSIEAIAETLAKAARSGHLDAEHELFGGPERFSATK